MTEGGVLRGWFIGHLSDVNGEDPGTVSARLDAWLAPHGALSASESPNLDKRVEALAVDRIQAQNEGDAYEVALIDCDMGAALIDSGRPFEALSRFMAARQTFVELGEDLRVGITDMELAIVTTHLGWYDSAEQAIANARKLVGLNGHLDDFARVLIAEASLNSALDDREGQERNLERARWLACESGAVTTMAVATHNLANAASSRGELDQALLFFSEARELHESTNEPVAVADCDDNAGAALIDAGRYAEGVALARTALDVYRRYDRLVEAAHSMRIIAHGLDHLGDHAEALELLTEAHEIFTGSNEALVVADCDIAMSYTLRTLGRFDEALDAIGRARTAYLELGRTDIDWFDEVDAHEHP